MDPLQLLSDLEGLHEKIPAGWLRDDFEGLIATIRNIYEMSIKFITPSQPVSDGKLNLDSHHTTLNDLCTQLKASQTSFQEVYTGSGSDSYHTTANASLQSLQTVRDHLATASQLHDTMAINFDTANEAQLALVALLAGLAVTLGVLIFSAGSTAPVTVPAAVVEAAGGAVSIGLLTDAEAAAAAAALSLIWTALPEAIEYGLMTAAGVAVIGQYAFAKSNSKTDEAEQPSKKACQKAMKLMEQVDRLVQKTGGKINPKRLAEIKQKLADGTLTSNDLPGSLQSEFPGELKGLTYQQIKNLCKGV